MTKPNPQKMHKWQRWLKEIENELIGLLGSRQIYKEYGKIVSKNERINKEGATFHRWIVDNYVTYVAMSIRRQADTDNDSISLARLISDIKNNPEQLTREWHIAHYQDMPFGVGPGLGGQNFTENAGSGYYMDPQIANNDLVRINELSQKINHLATRSIAHKSTRSIPRVTFDDVDKCIDTTKEIAEKYILLLTASQTELEPVIPDWQGIFTMQWIKTNE